MSTLKYSAMLAFAAIASAGAAQAQTTSTPTAEALGLARTLVEKSGTGGEQALSGLALPIPDYLHQLGVSAPDQMRTLSHDVIMPALGEHVDDLTDLQVKSYAALLSIADMKAAIAFYDSPAGRNFVNSGSRRMQANLPQGAALIAQLRPEIQRRAQDVAHAHGWPPPPG